MKKSTFLILTSIASTLFITGCNSDNNKVQDTNKTTTENVKVEENTSQSPMNKYLASLPQGLNAQEAKKLSDISTDKLYQDYFVNGKGKKELEETISIINKRIEYMTNRGVFNGTNLNTFFSDRNSEQSDLLPILNILKGMSSLQSHLYKQLIASYYIQKGYSVREGEHNYEKSFHYYINW